MQLVLGNPYGALALLGIPAIVLIHFIQERAKPVEVSTLFLLPELRQHSREARAFDWVRNSLVLWLQILAVVVLSWLFVDPRWVGEDSIQRVVLVLDSSQSMTAFQTRLSHALQEKVQQISSVASRTEWVLLESDPRAEPLYNGGDAQVLLTKIAAWEPHLGDHDIGPVLEMARRLAGPAGWPVFISDHEVELPEGVTLLSVGEPIANCGFSGATIEERGGKTTFQALVKNYSTELQRRNWWIEQDGTPGEKQQLNLQPGAQLLLSGIFPSAKAKLVLVLEADRFALDDELPLLVPVEKELKVFVERPMPFNRFVRRLLRVIPNLATSAKADQANLYIGVASSKLEPRPVPAITFRLDESGNPERSNGPVVSERTELARDLSWESLIVGRRSSASIIGSDENVIVWDGSTPLIAVNHLTSAPELLVDFDLRVSNAPRLPSFIVLLHRFIASVRSITVGFEQQNVELHQLISPAIRPSAGEVTVRVVPAGENASKTMTLPPAQAPFIRAPARPSFFQIEQKGEVLFSGAAQFADVREADFSKAVEVDRLKRKTESVARAHSRPDAFRTLWIVLFLIVLFASWFCSTNGWRKSLRGDLR